MSPVSSSLGPEVSFVPFNPLLVIPFSPCSWVSYVDVMCDIPAALMLIVFMLVPNVTKPLSFILEASGGTIAVWRRHVRQRGKIKKTDRIKSKGERKGRRKKNCIIPE